VKITVKDIKTQMVRAEMCAEATLPGEWLREILRLALIGLKEEQAAGED
jgi:hypothetical protein